MMLATAGEKAPASPKAKKTLNPVGA